MKIESTKSQALDPSSMRRGIRRLVGLWMLPIMPAILLTTMPLQAHVVGITRAAGDLNPFVGLSVRF
jgi:hypothetical protein